MTDYPEFNRQLSITIFKLYEMQIRKPMLKKKAEHIEELKQRNDFELILVLNFDDDQIYKDLKKKVFNFEIQ